MGDLAMLLVEWLKSGKGKHLYSSLLDPKYGFFNEQDEIIQKEKEGNVNALDERENYKNESILSKSSGNIPVPYKNTESTVAYLDSITKKIFKSLTWKKKLIWPYRIRMI